MSVVAKVSPKPKTLLRLERAISQSLYVASLRAAARSARWPKGCQPRPRHPSTARCCRPGLCQEPPRHPLPQSRLVDELLGQGDVRDVGCGELVRDGHPVGRTKQVQLHPIDAEGTPPYPRGSRKARRLPDLTRMENFEQRRINEQGLRLTYELGEDLPPQRLQVAPELLHPPVEGGRVESHHPRKQVREEPLGIPQERAFALHAPKLLEQGEGDHFRVRKPLYGLVASGTVGVEQGVSVIYEAEEHGQSLFQVDERGGMLGLGHPRCLSLRVRMAPVVPSIHATLI